MKGTKWYSLDPIHKFKNIQYYMIFGERSNGKSFAVDKHILDDYFRHGKEFVICKRFADDIKMKIASTMLTPLYDYVLEEYDMIIKFYNGRWLCHHKDQEPKVTDCQVMGYALALNESDRVKGSQFPKVGNIVFEEFMSIGGRYLPDEINLFLNLVSTITRNRLDTKIYMLGNAISKHSPYADALGVRLHRLNKGEITLREFKNKKGQKTRFAIERTANVDVFDTEENIEGIVYNVFGNSGLGQMISTGEFETRKYNLQYKGITFKENVQELGEGKWSYFLKQDMTALVVAFEDYYYRIYSKQIDNNVVYGFRPIPKEQIKAKTTAYILNTAERFEGITNIRNFGRFNDGVILPVLQDIHRAKSNGQFVFMSDDNGEDVQSAFNIMMTDKS